MDSEGWLALLTEVAQRNTVSGHLIVLNRRQCRYLAETCCSMLRKMSLPLTRDRLVNELRGILENIQAFFLACSERFWLEYLAIQLETKEAYQVHLRDFMLFFATLDSISQHQSRGLPFGDIFIQSMQECDRSLSNRELSEHVRLDRSDMVSLLDSKQQQQKQKQKQKQEEQQYGCMSTFKRRFPCFVPRQEKRSLNVQQAHIHCLSAFLARKCDVVVSLTAAPEDAPKNFFIDPKEISSANSCLIGEGTFGSVYERTWMGQRVAVKVCGTKHPCFINEAAMLAGLSNPYIIPLIGWSMDKKANSYSLIMELMDGDLSGHMAENALSIEVAVDIMLQISRGMEYLHTNKVIHRDLKPTNVLVKPCKHKAGYLKIKLADFGVAKFQPDTPFYSTEKQGTYYYRAPEVLGYANSDEVHELPTKYTVKADVFSFAILCYEILAAKAPECFFCTPKEFFNRVIKNVRPVLPQSCPLLVSDCINRCWDCDPSQRPSFTDINKVLVYMKAALIGLRSPRVAGSSLMLNAFVKIEAPTMTSPIDEEHRMSEDI